MPGTNDQGNTASDRLIAATRELRDKLLADLHRPKYHFVSPEGICHPFDPNGAIFWKGEYHLMYIVQDPGHCWGHAVSADLLHWRILPVALRPGNGDEGIFSGGAFVNKDGVPTIIYHGCRSGNSLAMAEDDELIRWKKYPGNPIVPRPEKGTPEFELYSSWDPHGWLEGDTYYAIFGGKTPTLFRSQDLAVWEYRGPFITDRKWIQGGDASCPDFFALGDRHVFVFIAHDQGAQYVIGRWDKEVFHPESHGMMNWPGGLYFAPESLVDDRGRRILWAWVCEARPRECAEQAGWSGVMALPRVLTLADDHTLRIDPVEELQRLRLRPRRARGIVVQGETAVSDVTGNCLELKLTIQPCAGPVGAKLLCTPDGQEQTVVAYDPVRRVLSLDVTLSSLSKDVRYAWPHPHSMDGPEEIRIQEAPLALQPGEPLELRIFLDHSIIEVFANSRQCVTQRVYPTRDDARGVVLFADGGATVTSMEAWDMAATNPW